MITLSLFRNSETQEFAVGETIFKTGEEGKLMYVVIEGEVDILVGTTLAETVTAGGIFGEMALIDRNTRSADAVVQVMSIMAERLSYANDHLLDTRR